MNKLNRFDKYASLSREYDVLLWRKRARKYWLFSVLLFVILSLSGIWYGVVLYFKMLEAINAKSGRTVEVHLVNGDAMSVFIDSLNERESIFGATTSISTSTIRAKDKSAESSSTNSSVQSDKPVFSIPKPPVIH